MDILSLFFCGILQCTHIGFADISIIILLTDWVDVITPALLTLSTHYDVYISVVDNVIFLAIEAFLLTLGTVKFYC